MPKKQTSTLGRVVIVVIETLILGLTFLFLAEYFGWRLVREAGGGAISRISDRNSGCGVA